MDNPKSQMLAKVLEGAVQETLNIASSVTEAHRFRQAGPGKAHPAWLLGHLANTANALVIQWVLGEASMIPKGFGRKYAPDFFGGHPVTPNPDDYFPWDEVVALYTQIGERAVAGVLAFDDAALPNPIAADMPDAMRQAFSSNEVVLIRAGSHDAYHRGQMALLNKLPD